MNEGPSVGDILIGIFVILFGLCIAFAGGGCTVMLVGGIAGPGGGWGPDYGIAALLLVVSLAILALGAFLIWVGFKLMTGRYRK
jgi:cation transporter-like permease